MMRETLLAALRDRELLPHQVEFIETALQSIPHGRVLLADDVGVGKTRAAAALVWAWAYERGHPPRTLIVSPAPLLIQWESRLESLGIDGGRIIDAAEYRRLEVRTETHGNPWSTVDIVLTSVDFLKHSDRLRLVLELPWDLVVFDEAHLGGAQNQRGQALRALWTSDRVDLMVAATATPFAGQAEDLELLAA